MSSSRLETLKTSYAIRASGIETSLIFHEKLSLPLFASFPLWNDEKGHDLLLKLLLNHINLAKKYNLNYMLETLTWRANPKWGAELGYSSSQIFEINKSISEDLKVLRSEHETDSTKLILCGVIGPKGDAYVPSDKMTAHEAQVFHSVQVSAFAEAGVDLVIACTMNYPEEAVGVIRAAKASNINVAISFTVETDAKLGCGISMEEFVRTVDELTHGGPLYYQVNCAHFDHIKRVLRECKDMEWVNRILGISPNASRKSHQELNESLELDDGNPDEFGIEINEIREILPGLRIFGGCCGTDLRHIESVCRSCFSDRISL